MAEAAGAYGAAERTGPRAGFGERLVAWIIDFVAIVVLEVIFARIVPALSVVIGVLGLAYFIYFEGSPSGQTVGKKIMNIRIVDATNGGPIGYGRATLRYFAKILSGIPCGLGYFWMLWDKDKQTWHDKLATDVVVPTSAYPVAAWPG